MFGNINNCKLCGSVPGLCGEAPGTCGLHGSTTPNSGTNPSVQGQPSSGGSFGFSFTTGSSGFVFGKSSQSSQSTTTPGFGKSTTTKVGCFKTSGFGGTVPSSSRFGFGTGGQSSQRSNLFGTSATSSFGSATPHTTHFANSGFGLNSAPGGLLGSKPFSGQSSGQSGSCAPGGLFGSVPISSQSSSLFGSYTKPVFGSAPSSYGNFGSKPGVGRFGDFSFGSASAPSVFGTNTQSAQSSFTFGRTTTPGFGNPSSITTGFGSSSAPSVFGTNTQSAQSSFPFFGRTTTPGFGNSGSTKTDFGSASRTSAFGTNTQSAQSSFAFGKFSTPGSGSFGSSATGFGAPFSSSGFGTNTQSAQSSFPFGTTTTPSKGLGCSTTGSSDTTTPVGTTFKFNPTTGVDTMMRAGISTNVTVRNQCITMMKEYQNKSLEELRVEDYAANRKGPQTSIICDTTGKCASLGKTGEPCINVVIGNPVQPKSSIGATGDAINDLIKGITTNLNLPADQKVVVFSIGTVIINKGSAGMDMMEESMSLNFDTQQKCATCMKDCGNKSLEEQRAEDCACNRKPLFPRGNFKGFSTTRRRALYAKRRGAPNAFTLANSTHWKPGLGADANTTPNGTTVQFLAPTGTDTMVKPSVKTDIQTRYQCITFMKEYENKSLEELRTEDYAANRKGVHVGDAGTTVKGCCTT